MCRGSCSVWSVQIGKLRSSSCRPFGIRRTTRLWIRTISGASWLGQPVFTSSHPLQMSLEKSSISCSEITSASTGWFESTCRGCDSTARGTSSVIDSSRRRRLLKTAVRLSFPPSCAAWREEPRFALPSMFKTSTMWRSDLASHPCRDFAPNWQRARPREIQRRSENGPSCLNRTTLASLLKRPIWNVESKVTSLG